MKRVAVIGSPGAGKTTFVRKLHERTGLPVIHLDYYYHQKEFDYYNDKKAWVKRVKRLIGRDEWIMDGNYSSSFEERFKRADTIIFLDFPRNLTFYRVLKRRIQYHNKQREEMPSDWEEKADKTFLKYVWNFPKNSRPKILDALKKSKAKTIILKNPNDVKHFLEKF